MSLFQTLQQAHNLSILTAEVGAFLHQTNALVLIRNEEARLLAVGLNAPVSKELSQARIQRVKRELATAKTHAHALLTKVSQVSYPSFLARGQADALEALQDLILDLDALAD